MDVVYVIGADSEELRYSLRSLGNLAGVDQVWIAGHCPKWVQGVETLTTRQKSDRYRNTSHNLRRAIGTKAVSDPFILFNDDFMALRPVEHRDYDRGPLRNYLETHRRASQYRNAALTAYLALDEMGFEDPLDFDLHLPLTVHKKLMTKAMRHSDAWKRTIYGNLALAEGAIETTTRTDVKDVTDGDDWVSTSYRSFTHGQLGELIRARFPEPSQYEVT